MSEKNSDLRYRVAAILAIALMAESASLPALAFRSSYGGVASHKKLVSGTESGSVDDIGFSPILLEMAKIVGRTGLPPGFFLQNDSPSFPDQPGIDLRTLLLYQAGLLKMPTKISGDKKQQSGPILSVAPLHPASKLFPESKETGPQLDSPHMPSEPEGTQVITPKRQVGSPDEISFGEKPRLSMSTAPIISFDNAIFQPPGDMPTPGTSEPLSVAMGMPRTGTLPFVTHSLFRIWTYRPTPSKTGSAAKGDTPYSGTFVIASPGVVRSISARNFTLGGGRLLAHNEGGELIFKTAFAEISIDPQATAIIELTDKGALKILALESASAGGVSVTTKVDNKTKLTNLLSGDEFIVAPRALTDLDLANSYSSTRKLDSFTAKGNVTLSQLVEKEALLRADMPSISGEQRFAINELRRRLRVSN